MANKIGSLIIDIEGQHLTSEDREILVHPLVGGIILFTRNYNTRAQLADLCKDIRNCRQQPVLIMVDQEGGRVQRFIEEFTRLPSMGVFGKLYDQNKDKALQLVKECGWLMATELISVGIDISLAPVLDLNKNMNLVIGERAFHTDPQKVINLATVFIAGMQEAGMAATGKHFPGHGSVTLDSHLALPVDERSEQEIRQEDMLTFTALIEAGIAAIMPAHIVFKQVDQHPVGYSKLWLQTILRQQLGFSGVIFSDDLSMEGANISTSFTDRMLAAREAGCDFSMICNNRSDVIQVLDEVYYLNHMIGIEKWGLLQADLTSLQADYMENIRWQTIHNLLNNFNGVLKSDAN